MTIALEHIQAEDWPAVNRTVDTLRSLVLDTGGQSLGIRVGTGTLTFPGASIFTSTLTVTHGLGRTPVVAFVVPMQGAATYIIVPETFSYTNTTFQVNAATSDNSTPAAATTKTIGWVAIG